METFDSSAPAVITGIPFTSDSLRTNVSGKLQPDTPVCLSILNGTLYTFYSCSFAFLPNTDAMQLHALSFLPCDQSCQMLDDNLKKIRRFFG